MIRRGTLRDDLQHDQPDRITPPFRRPAVRQCGNGRLPCQQRRQRAFSDRAQRCRIIPDPAPGRHRAAVHLASAQRASARHVRLRRRWQPAVLLDHQVRQRHWLAKLLCADYRRRGHPGRPVIGRSAHRGALCALWRPPRPRVRRWPGPHRQTLLHGWRGAEIRGDLSSEWRMPRTQKAPPKRGFFHGTAPMPIRQRRSRPSSDRASPLRRAG